MLHFASDQWLSELPNYMQALHSHSLLNWRSLSNIILHISALCRYCTDIYFLEIDIINHIGHHRERNMSHNCLHVPRGMKLWLITTLRFHVIHGPVANCRYFTITGIVIAAIVVSIGETLLITVAVSSIRKVHTTGTKCTTACKSSSNTTWTCDGSR